MNIESYLTENAPDYKELVQKAWPSLNILLLWDVGSYQGSIYVVGYVDNKVLVSSIGYGSCSGCGGWFEEEDENSGAPRTSTDVINEGVFGESLEVALKWVDEQPVDSYQCLTTAEQARLKEEVKRAYNLINTPGEAKHD